MTLPETASDAGKTPRIGGAIGVDVANICAACEGYGYDIFPEVDCAACQGTGSLAPKQGDTQDILRIVDSCGGADVANESADWNRGYNEALEAVDRELKRYFARNSTP